MTSVFCDVENKADAATNLPSFPIKLNDVKRVVTEILSLFGRSQIFDEYTVHDIRHINDMLIQLEWLIPETTKTVMTPADWLMIVLAVYLHDIGLIVTEEEFAAREKSGFPNFCNDILFAGPSGADYKSKISALPDDKRDRFLYQEFVRHNHAKRVRSWVEGKASTNLGFAKKQAEEIDKLLTPLKIEFRRDLALVCESHNLDDLDNVKKYPVSQPYGNSDAETANVQYCAALLRTVDLLQITERRAPSILFRMIDPSDPISQIEWSKQNAVRRIRAKPELDREGNATNSIQSQTVEVYATFRDEDSFFGLTSYLNYAEAQLGQTYNVLHTSYKLLPKKYEFPWRYIDSTNVGVDGFLTTPFGFEIDQEKILNLLTGHTLYNDSDVVVRELTQNAIDAVRLQSKIEHRDSSSFGKVSILWNSKEGELSIVDNGTGMTQSIIEDHLLRVGSSRYQDPKFKELFPDFNSISRFGIGVLSSFMVADSVEIVTVSTEENEARKISLRSVHGKYLIKLLDKHHDPDARALSPHGTSFKLRFRRTAKPINVAETVKQWVMFPKCSVTVKIDDGDAEAVGFTSPEDALNSYLKKSHGRLYDQSKIKVVERTIEGVTVAYALQHSSHYRDWSFVSAPEGTRRQRQPRPEYSPIATCVEGIAVEFDTPGFQGRSILAVANISGREAPRTNVARSLVEATAEKELAIKRIYNILFDNVTQESRRLKDKEGYSLTWSIEQIPYLLGPITNTARVPNAYRKAHHEAFSTVPMFLVEDGGGRAARALRDLHSYGEFWTVDSQLMRSVGNFVREAKSDITARELVVASQGSAAAIPDGALLANSYRADLVQSAFQADFEPVVIVGNVSDRRLDLLWKPENDRWISMDQIVTELYSSGMHDVVSYFQEHARTRVTSVMSATSEVASKNLDGYFAVRAGGKFYILPNSPIAKLIESPKATTKINQLFEQFIYMSSLPFITQRHDFDGLEMVDAVERYFRSLESQPISRYLPPIDHLRQAISEMAGGFNVFDPLSWSLRDNKADDIPF